MTKERSVPPFTHRAPRVWRGRMWRTALPPLRYFTPCRIVPETAAARAFLWGWLLRIIADCVIPYPTSVRGRTWKWGRGHEMRFVKDDGGRAAAGFKGEAGDCVTRAIAIATGRPYRAVYDAINDVASGERRGRRKRGVSSARSGVYKGTKRKYLESLGWEWV